MEYAFVTSTDLRGLSDAKSKRQIRQHASREMWKSRKGDRSTAPGTELPVRPVGKGRTSAKGKPYLQLKGHPHKLLPRTSKIVEYTGSLMSTLPGTEQTDEQDASEEFAGVIQRIHFTRPVERLGAGRLDPFTHYPIKMNTLEQRIVHHVLDDDLPSQLRYYRAFSYPQALAEPAAFYQFLSAFTLDVHLRFPEVLEKARDLSMNYHGLALACVNKSISDPALRTSDSLIFSILGFVRYYCLMEDWDALEVHMQGLHEVVRLKGGIDKAFIGNEALVLLFCFTDVNVAYVHDRMPAFPSPERILPNSFSLDFPKPPYRPESLARQISSIWRAKFQGAGEAVDILDDLYDTMDHLVFESINSEGNYWSTSTMPILLLDPIVHRLLRLRSDDVGTTDPVQGIQESFRVAALLFIGRLRRWDSEDASMKVLTAKHLLRLQQCMQRIVAVDWGELWPLRLWALVMGGMETGRGSPERLWYTGTIRGILNSKGLTSYRQVEKMVKGILWVDEVFRERARMIWSDSAVLFQKAS